MAVNVTIAVSGGEAPIASYEISGGADGEIRPSDGAKTFKIGQVGSSVSFLTVKRIGDGTISVRSSPKATFEVDGNYKSPKKTTSFKFSAKNTKLMVRELVKK